MDCVRRELFPNFLGTFFAIRKLAFSQFVFWKNNNPGHGFKSKVNEYLVKSLFHRKI